MTATPDGRGRGRTQRLLVRTVIRWFAGVAVGVAFGAGGVLVLQNVGTPADGGREASGGQEDATAEPAPASRGELVQLSVAAPVDIPEEPDPCSIPTPSPAR